MEYPKNGLNGQHNHPPPEESKDQLFFLDTRSLLFRFLRNWWLFVIGIALGVAYVKFKQRYIIPVYQVRSTLIIDGGKQDIDLTGLLGVGGKSGQAGDLTNEITVLKSRTLMRKVVDSLDLHVSYFLEGRVKTTEFYKNPPVVVANALPLETAYGKTLRIHPIDEKQFQLILEDKESPLYEYGKPFHHSGVIWQLDYRFLPVESATIVVKLQWPDAVAGKLASSLIVNPMIRSNVLTLGLNNPNIEKARDILETLSGIYNHSVIEAKNEVNLKTLAFIDERLHFVTQDLYQVEKEVEEFKQSRELPLDVRENAGRNIGLATKRDEEILELEVQKVLLSNIESIF
ncbi:MAG: hypothetical protein IPG32_09965 [Saprospirales bacterium]|nr:hypothetical protein [Saprospirales bacterium]